MGRLKCWKGRKKKVQHPAGFEPKVSRMTLVHQSGVTSLPHERDAVGLIPASPHALVLDNLGANLICFVFLYLLENIRML